MNARLKKSTGKKRSPESEVVVRQMDEERESKNGVVMGAMYDVYEWAHGPW